MPAYKNQTLRKYLQELSLRVPVPGGGSAAALSGALGAALISMVANYSIRKDKTRPTDHQVKDILRESEKIRKRLLEIVDLDAKAYLGVVKTRKANSRVKNAALKKAREVPLETCRLCYKAVELTPFLVEHGNQHLLSDVRVALELLIAAFNSALVNVEINQ